MAEAFKLTQNSAEIPFGVLFKGDALSVPYFQRPYKWTKAKIDDLCADVDAILENISTVHFLGAVITFNPAAEHSGAFKREDVIDGQQRITTAYLLLCGAIRVLIDNKAFDDAVDYFKSYVVSENARRKGYEASLEPSHGDREALNEVVEDLLKTKAFREELGAGFSFLHLKVSGSTPAKSGKRISGGYGDAKRYFKKKYDTDGVDGVKEAMDVILSRLTLVHIRVVDTLSGPKIFNSLNAKQEAMTVGDLIRNDIFKQEVEKNPALVEQLHDTKWLPFFNRFMEISPKAFDDYFFPFGLTQDPNVKKSDVHAKLMKIWESNAPAEIIEALEAHQNCYIDLIQGTNVSDFKPPLATAMKRFKTSRAPTSVYPFVMNVTHAFKSNSIDEKTTVEILDLVDQFLTRRALTGTEPTGLHAVFKGLWRDIERNPTAATAAEAIRKHKTVLVPTDEEVEAKVRTENAYSSKITPYVLEELNKSLGGDRVSVDKTNIEHVYPRNPKTGEWSAFHGFEEAKDRLANLIPLSDTMNKSLQNGEYEKKRTKYKTDSAFKMARQFAEKYETWTPTTLAAREDDLVVEILRRWPKI